MNLSENCKIPNVAQQSDVVKKNITKDCEYINIYTDIYKYINIYNTNKIKHIH